MPPATEIDAITTLDNILSQLHDPVMRDRVLKWAWDKFATKPLPSLELSVLDMNDRRPATKKKAKKVRKAKTSSKAKLRPSIVKDLDLNPKGKKPFKDFVQEKQPATNQEKCAIAVYYLRRELGLKTVSTDHVYTCYKNVVWRIPADLYNVLLLTASRKGWIDTSNTNSISVTTQGENLVEHDLPRKAKDKT
jgi:hypothetical protein